MTIVGNGISVLALKAKIHVKTMPGATVSFIKGGVTAATMTANGSGNCDYEILVPNFGEWTVSASGGGGSGSSSVTVSDVVTYNVTVVLTRYFIKDGNFVSGVTHNHVPSERWFKDDGDYVILQTYQGGSNEYTSGYLSPAVAFGYWKTLYIDSQEVGDGANAGVSSGHSAQQASFSASVQLCSRRETWDSRHTSSCSVASVTGSQYLALRAKAWINSESIPVHGAGGQIKVWNMWLSG